MARSALTSQAALRPMREAGDERLEIPPASYSSPIRRAAITASYGIDTLPYSRIRFFPCKSIRAESPACELNIAALQRGGDQCPTGLGFGSGERSWSSG